MIRRKAGRWAVWSTAAVLAVLAVVSGSDRAGVSLVSNGPFAQSARMQAAISGVGAGRPALAPSQALVRYAPLRRGHLSVLALALAGAGRANEAERALAAALATGWRDPVAQGLAVDAAVRGDEPAVATARTEALLRTDPESPLAQAALARMAEAPVMRAALAQALARNEAWTAAGLTGAGSMSGTALSERLALLEQAHAAGWRPDMDEVRRFTGRLFEISPPAAWTAWRALAGPGDTATHGLWDGSFAGIGTEAGFWAGPFAWNPRTGSSAAVRAEGGRLTVSGGGLIAEPVAVQRVMLDAGTHVLVWRSTRRAQGDPALTLSAECPAASRALEQGPVLQVEGRHARRIHLASPCAVAITMLALSGNSGERSIEDVRLGQIGG